MSALPLALAVTALALTVHAYEFKVGDLVQWTSEGKTLQGRIDVLDFDRRVFKVVTFDGVHYETRSVILIGGTQ